MSTWKTVPESSLPPGALDLNTYRPDERQCVKGHPFTSEADCILPEDDVDAWDCFLCRVCVAELEALPKVILVTSEALMFAEQSIPWPDERPYEETLDESERRGD